jgi:hypothetical protein
LVLISFEKQGMGSKSIENLDADNSKSSFDDCQAAQCEVNLMNTWVLLEIWFLISCLEPEVIRATRVVCLY